MKINVIASGSKGNCTWLKTSANENILLDVGIPYKRIAQAMDNEAVDYAFVTHEHGDHANPTAIQTLLERGTEIYMSEGTRFTLKLEKRHNLHIVRAHLDMPLVEFGTCKFNALRTFHDATEPNTFSIFADGERLLYATDTRHVPIWNDGRAFTILMVEANFSNAALEKSSIDEWRKERIYENHLSIENVLSYFDWLKRYEKITGEFSQLKEVHLMHISKRHGDGTEFKKKIAEVVGDIPIYTH